MLRAILTVGGWTMVSRILGFARDILIAARLGAGPVADAFFVALKLPNLFRRLFGEGAFNAAFIPAFAGTLADQGAAAARDLAERMATLLALWLALLVAVGIWGMPWLMQGFAPGFAANPEKFALAVELTRITFPYLWCICLVALFSGVLNAMDRFTAAAAAPLLFNLLSMAGLVGLGPFLATPAHGLAWGITASGFAQLAILAVAAAQAGMALRLWRRPTLTPGVRVVLRRMVPGVFGAGVTQLNLAIDVVIASLLPSGAVSYLYYADRVAQLPLGVIGAAIGTALLPLLSRQLRGGATLSAHRSQNRAVELAVLFALPAAVGMACAAHPIIATLFQRGAFGAAETAATAAALAAYAVGLPAFVLLKALAPGFFARGDTVAPVRIGIAVVALNLALNLAFAPFLGHVGIALATSLAAWVNVLALAWLLARRGQLRADRRLRHRAPCIVLATLAMAAILLALRAAGAEGAPGLLVLLAAGAATYAGAAWALGVLRPAELRAILRRRAPA